MRTGPATPAQLAYVEQLAAERDTSGLYDPRKPGQELSAAQASALIDQLKALPVDDSGPLANRHGAPAGVYRDAWHRIVRLRPNGELTRLYAEVLTMQPNGTARWVYEQGAGAGLRPEHQLKAWQAAEFGLETGVCAMCGRQLKDPESLVRGIGPDCNRKLTTTRGTP